MKITEIGSSTLDHHGLVAGTIQELKIAERIDRLIPQTDPRCIVSTGTSVAAMIINGLGFNNRRLYVVSQFFENKPMNELLGTTGLEPSDLNDDTLGRALDRIFKYGVVKLFCTVAFEILVEHKLFGPFARSDTTSISVEGEYKSSKENDGGAVQVTYGHSKDIRPDLKQFMVLIGMTGPANLPFFLEPLAGNKSDKISLPGAIDKVKAFHKHIGDAPLFTWVADSGMYSKEHLLHAHYQTPWITRVPESINDALILIEKSDDEFNWKMVDENYKIHCEESMYGGVLQRWILVFSQKAYEREKQTFDRRVEKEKVAFETQLARLSKTEFGCKEDAHREYESLCRSCPMFSTTVEIKLAEKHIKRGRPKSDQKPVEIFKATPGAVILNAEHYNAKLSHKGRFILTTNQLDHALLSDEAILKEYKGQAKVERGFSFLKDPWFLVGSVFLKSTQRITALTMIMTLCLLVYNYMTYRTRKALVDRNQTVKSQAGKPVQNPTPRWLFQCMEGIAMVHTFARKQKSTVVTNLTENRRQIISIFGPQARNIYGCS